MPAYKSFTRIVLAYDSTSLSWSMERERFHPHVYIDIPNYLEHKLKALELHQSLEKALAEVNKTAAAKDLPPEPELKNTAEVVMNVGSAVQLER